MRSSEREKQSVRQQLTRKEAELTSAVETIWREQQQIEERRQRVSVVCEATCVVCVVTRGCPVTTGG